MLWMSLCYLHWWQFWGIWHCCCTQLAQYVVVVPGLAVRLTKLLNFLSVTGACSHRAVQHQGLLFSDLPHEHIFCFCLALMLMDSPYSPFGVVSLNKTNELSFSFPCSFKIFIMLLFLFSYSSTCPEQFKMEKRLIQEMNKKYFWHNKMMLLSST